MIINNTKKNFNFQVIFITNKYNILKYKEMAGIFHKYLSLRCGLTLNTLLNYSFFLISASTTKISPSRSRRTFRETKSQTV